MNFYKIINNKNKMILAALGSLLLIAPIWGCGYGGDTIMIGSADGEESFLQPEALEGEESIAGAGALEGEGAPSKHGEKPEGKALAQAEGERLSGQEEEETLIRVYVCGAVINPGVVSLPAESRVEDALIAAGGFKDDALRQALNLADWVCDGQMLYFPAEGEDMERLAAGGWPGYGTQSGMGAEPGSGQAAGLVNINTADEAALITLPGIGEGRAKDIIAYREEYGRFNSPEDIMKVSGIKTSVYEKICDKITVK